MNVLLIGLGSIGLKHVNALKKIDSEVDIFALRSSPSSKHVEGVIDLYDFDEIQSHQFNFCIISTPTANHKQDISKMVNLGIPLFIEKPLFHTLQIKETVELLNASKIKTYVACNLRFLDCVRFVQNELHTKQLRINEVSVYCGSYLPDWRQNKNYKEIYSAKPEMGGGVHLDLIHEIDYVYWLLGKPKSVRKNLSSNSSIDIESIDYANYLLSYEDFCASITLNYYRRDAKRTFELVCSEGTYYVDLLRNQVTFNEEIVYSSKQTFIETYTKQLVYFIDNMNKKTFNDANEALEVLKICLHD